MLYGTLKDRKLALGAQGHGQEFLHSTLGLLSCERKKQQEHGAHTYHRGVGGFPGASKIARPPAAASPGVTPAI